MQDIDSVIAGKSIECFLAEILGAAPKEEEKWWLAVGGKKYGPYMDQQIHTYLLEGRVKYNSVVFASFSEIWEAIPKVILKRTLELGFDNDMVKFSWRCIARIIVKQLYNEWEMKGNTCPLTNGYADYFRDIWDRESSPEESLLKGDYLTCLKSKTEQDKSEMNACWDRCQVHTDPLVFMLANMFSNRYRDVQRFSLNKEQLAWLRSSPYLVKYQFLTDYQYFRKTPSWSFDYFAFAEEGIKHGSNFALNAKMSFLTGAGDKFIKLPHPYDTNLAKNKKEARRCAKQLLRTASRYKFYRECAEKVLAMTRSGVARFFDE